MQNAECRIEEIFVAESNKNSIKFVYWYRKFADISSKLRKAEIMIV